MCVSGGKRQEKESEGKHSVQATNGISCPLAHQEAVSMSMPSLTLFKTQCTTSLPRYNQQCEFYRVLQRAEIKQKCRICREVSVTECLCLNKATESIMILVPSIYDIQYVSIAYLTHLHFTATVEVAFNPKNRKQQQQFCFCNLHVFFVKTTPITATKHNEAEIITRFIPDYFSMLGN